jgi:hypothetical protein
MMLGSMAMEEQRMKSRKTSNDSERNSDWLESGRSALSQLPAKPQQ